MWTDFQPLWPQMLTTFLACLHGADKNLYVRRASMISAVFCFVPKPAHARMRQRTHTACTASYSYDAHIHDACVCARHAQAGLAQRSTAPARRRHYTRLFLLLLLLLLSLLSALYNFIVHNNK